MTGVRRTASVKDFFENYTTEATALSRYANLCLFALDRLTGHADLEDVLYPHLERATEAKPGTYTALLPPTELRTFAREQQETGFPMLYEVASVRLWSLLESAVDDAIRVALSEVDPAKWPSGLRSIKGPIVDLLLADEQARSEFVLDALKQETRATLKSGVGRFEALLEAVGCGGAVHASVRRGLLEFSEVRNVIVHRNSVADERFLARCPWLGLILGERLVIDDRRFKVYRCSSDWYVFDVLTRVLRVCDPASASRDDFVAKMAGHKAAFEDELARMSNAEGGSL